MTFPAKVMVKGKGKNEGVTSSIGHQERVTTLTFRGWSQGTTSTEVNNYAFSYFSAVVNILQLLGDDSICLRRVESTHESIIKNQEPNATDGEDHIRGDLGHSKNMTTNPIMRISVITY